MGWISERTGIGDGSLGRFWISWPASLKIGMNKLRNLISISHLLTPIFSTLTLIIPHFSNLQPPPVTYTYYLPVQ